MPDKPTNTRKWLLIGGAIVGFIALILAILTPTVFIPQSVLSEGNTLEQGVSAAYNDGALTLSNCVNKTFQAANLANAQSDALADVFRAAVGGRYNQPGSPQVDSGKLFSAIQEAYPDLTGLNQTFNNVLAVITGCQDDYATKQRVVQDKVRDFNSWLTGSWRVRTFGGGLPNNNLKASIPGAPTLYGQAALDKMSQPIVDASVGSAYNTGQTQQTNPFGTREPAPTSAPR
jgi:hypothetical protein